MNSRLRILSTVFALFIAASSLSGCSFEPGEHTQLVGQECFLDRDCVEGALCVERRCRYEARARTSGAGDAGDDAVSDSEDTSPHHAIDVEHAHDANLIDVGGEQDAMPQVCNPSASRCISHTQYESCLDDGSGFTTRTCEDGLRCQRGECIPVNLSTCEFQDQPCNQEGFSNGFYCGDIGESGSEMRCHGICSTVADNPDATCPEEGSVCAFGDDEGGLCLSGCDLDQGCDVPGHGCLPADGQQSEGVCVPYNPANRVGERCDGQNFFDCEEGAICIDVQNGARCVEACRAFTGGAGSDCNNGHCMPLTASLGICRRDAGNRTEGDQCRQAQLYRTCGDDAVLCAPSGGWQPPQCTRFCRLDEGDADCSAQQSCFQYDNQRDDLGVCVDG